jgi:hypothetical protein
VGQRPGHVLVDGVLGGVPQVVLLREEKVEELGDGEVGVLHVHLGVLRRKNLEQFPMGVVVLTFKKLQMKRETLLSSLLRSSFCSFNRKLWNSWEVTVFRLAE